MPKKRRRKASKRVIEGRSKFLLLAREILNHANGSKYYSLYVTLIRYFDKLAIHLGQRKLDKIRRFVIDQLKKVADPISDAIGIISERKFLLLKKLDSEQKTSKSFQEQTKDIASKIIELVSGGIKFGKQMIQPSVNIGVSIFPKDGKKIDTLVETAELALEEAERKGSNTFSLFEGGSVVEFKQIGKFKELYEAIRSGRMYMVLQPIVDLKDGMKIKIIELLLRWKGRNIDPQEIISISEEVGITRLLNEFIFGELAEISQRLGKYCFSFNISPQHLTISFVKSIIENTRRYNIDTERIYLEISEKSRFEEIKEFLKNIELLKDAGFKFIIDDFGSPSSVISHLKYIPAEIVKIDKTILSEASRGYKFSKVLIQGIVWLAKNLDMKVCAEGVETERELELVRELDFDLAQGFLFSPPVVEEELVVL